MPERRILFVDPSLIGARGHNLGLAQTISAQLKGSQIWYAINRRAESPLALPESGPTLRVFRYTMAEAARVRRYGRILAALSPIASSTIRLTARGKTEFNRAGGERLVPQAAVDAGYGRSVHSADLKTAVLAFDPKPQDVVLLASADAEQGLALAELLEAGFGRGIRFFVRLMYDDRSRHATDFTWSTMLARLLRAAGGAGSVQLATETTRFADEITRQTNKHVVVWPHPSGLEACAAPLCRDPFLLLIPGEARLDKGRAQIQSVIERVSSAWGARVVFRCQSPAFGGQVQPLPAHLDAPGYAAAWRDCHAAVLLNDPAVYRLRGSGVVCDAVTAGRPFVCLEGSTLEEWTRDGNAISAAFDLEAISNAIDKLVGHYAEFLVHTRSAQARMAQLQENAVRALGVGP